VSDGLLAGDFPPFYFRAFLCDIAGRFAPDQPPLRFGGRSVITVLLDII